MGSSAVDQGDKPAVSPDVAAEAAVWVARLHGPSRSAQMERDCLAWQARSAAHREAFERCTETWQDVPRVTVASAFASAAGSSARRPRVPRRVSPALWLTAAAVVASVALSWWHRGGGYGTGLGEQQRVVLDDGSRMTLNTDTRASVDLGDSERRVTLSHGEALFQVAKDARRPFVVRAGGTAITAIGTTFSVRFTPDVPEEPALAVTLVEGRVSVQAADGEGVAVPSEPKLMQPGDRVRLSRVNGVSEVPALRVDRPKLEVVTAWQRNEAVFDDVALNDAVAEMNRYSRTPIVLIDAPSVASLRVSGLYRTGDSAGFARAVAALHGLELRDTQGRLELAKPQSGNR